MFVNESRLLELSAKTVEGVITDEEFAEMMQLSKAKKQVREVRTALVAGFRGNFEKYNVTIHDIFSASEIAAAAYTRGASVPLETMV